MKDKNIIDKLLLASQKAGATQSEVLIERRFENHATVRLSQIESLERSEKNHLALRVWVGKKKSLIATEDLEESSLHDLSERAVAIAQATPEDPASRLASKEEFATTIMDLQLEDSSMPQEKELIARAITLEQSARSVKNITNSEGASCGFKRHCWIYATSEGFEGQYSTTDHAIAVSVVAGEGSFMERDYEFKNAPHWQQIGDCEALGKAAGNRAVQRLNPQKIKTEAMPVIYAPRVASSLLRHLIEALRGDRLARGTSFLGSLFGEKIMPESITILDDPHRLKGHRSRPFDSEGLLGGKSVIIEKGVLTGRFLDLRCAHLLKASPTGHGSRKITEHPSPTASNLSVSPSADSEDKLMSDIERGFYATELLGLALNLENGDYSRGASGFLIEKGQLSYAVNEVTIAGNLKDIFADLRAADNLELKSGIDAPSLRSDAMMVAGK